LKLYFGPVKYANDDALPYERTCKKEMIVSHWPMAMMGPGDDNISLVSPFISSSQCSRFMGGLEEIIKHCTC
jgi:hypothetical protein